MKIKAQLEERQEAKTLTLAALPNSEHSSSRLSRSASSKPSGRNGHHIRIPKLELLTFNGNSLNWPVFWERFSSAIDSNPGLTDEEKLSYLREAMKNKLAQQIVSPTTSDVHSYSIFLALLKMSMRTNKKSLLSISKY